MISKSLMTKISHVSWGGYDKGFYGIISRLAIEYTNHDLDSSQASKLTNSMIWIYAKNKSKN